MRARSVVVYNHFSCGSLGNFIDLYGSRIFGGPSIPSLAVGAPSFVKYGSKGSRYPPV
jgi:hypothetical protein